MNYLEISTLFLFIIFLVLFYIINLINNEINANFKKEQFDNHLTEADVQRAKQEMERTKRLLDQAKREFNEYKAKVDKERKDVNNNIQSIENWEGTRKHWFDKFLSNIKYLQGILAEQEEQFEEIKKLQKKYEGSKSHRDYPNSNYNKMQTLNEKFYGLQKFNEERGNKINDLTIRINEVNNMVGSTF